MQQPQIASWSQRAALGAASLVFLLSACKSEASRATTEPASEAKAPVAGDIAPASAAGTAAAAAANLNAKCPAGRWSYDYSDQALEAMMKNVAGAKVVKEEGAFICTVSEGTQGMITCDTQGKPVQNIVETNQAGLKMTISVTIDGKAVTQFKLLDAQRMQVVSSDTSGLKIGSKVTLGGKEIPFPTDRLLSIFGKPESTLGYKCEGGKLFIKPQLENTEGVWQELEPVK
jgi:hypothetical protein